MKTQILESLNTQIQNEPEFVKLFSTDQVDFLIRAMAKDRFLRNAIETEVDAEYQRLSEDN